MILQTWSFRNHSNIAVTFYHFDASLLKKKVKINCSIQIKYGWNDWNLYITEFKLNEENKDRDEGQRYLFNFFAKTLCVPPQRIKPENQTKII